MSERERWIVYPLLFFALGAALRDKLLQRVESKEVICESLTIVDQDQPLVPLAEFGSKQTAKMNKLTTTTYLRVDEVLCEGVNIADRKDPSNVLVVMGTSATPSVQPGEEPRRVGVIVLKNDADSQVSEIRADQFLGSRFACNQFFVLDPVNQQPLVVVGAEPIPGVSVQGQDPPVSYQGVIYLNNRPLGMGSRLAPPIQPAPESPRQGL